MLSTTKKRVLTSSLVLRLLVKIKKTTRLFTLFRHTTAILKQRQLLPASFRRQMLSLRQDLVQDVKILSHTFSVYRSLKKLQPHSLVLIMRLLFRRVEKFVLWSSLMQYLMTRWCFLQEISFRKSKASLNIRVRLR